MTFPTKLLNHGEKIVLDLRPHWWFMFKTTMALLLAVALGIVVAVFLGEEDGWYITAAQWGSIALIVLALVWFGFRYLKWRTTNFVVTTDRLVHRAGIIAKTGVEIPLERVNTVFFNQGVFERMIGAGDLSIESGGEFGKQSFSDIRKPSQVQNEIYKQMEDNSNRMYSGGGPAAAAPSLARQLDDLDALRQRGVLTEAEFAAKKAELLERM